MSMFPQAFLVFAVVTVFPLCAWYWKPRNRVPRLTLDPSTVKQQPIRKHSRPRRARGSKKPIADTPLSSPQPPQPIDAFLVLDVEATCQQGTDLNYPNEIIEFPVCLLRWKNEGQVSRLEVDAEFRSFARPSWRPLLSKFCTELTGITQEQVNNAPPFSEVLDLCRQFLVEHGLIDPETGRRLVRYCWCSDGPFDIRDFIVKQCFISKVVMPEWLRGDVLDVRTAVTDWFEYRNSKGVSRSSGVVRHTRKGVRRPLNISAQLKALGLPEFKGRQHSGIDDCRNISRVVVELARRGITLEPNTTIYPDKKWHWMGKNDQILEWSELLT